MSLIPDLEKLKEAAARGSMPGDAEELLAEAINEIDKLTKKVEDQEKSIDLLKFKLKVKS